MIFIPFYHISYRVEQSTPRHCFALPETEQYQIYQIVDIKHININGFSMLQGLQFKSK
jgi:hypothetical protein